MPEPPTHSAPLWITWGHVNTDLNDTSELGERSAETSITTKQRTNAVTIQSS